MIKKYIRKSVIALTLITAPPMLISIAQAQTNGARATIKSDAPVEAECRLLVERMKELDKLEQRRLLDRGNRYESQRPYKSQEWLRQQRSDTQTKMFFAKC